METTKKIRSLLTEHGVEILNTDLKTGLIAVVRGEKSGKSVCFRADIDALPITEQTNLPYASENEGVMHACGHDFHTVCALFAALRLQEQKSTLCGCVYFAFEFAEEILGGAEALLQTEALNDVEEFYAIHAEPAWSVGTVGVHPGGVMAAFDRFRIDVHGAGTHAATPHLGKNPIPVLVSLVQALQTHAVSDIPNDHRYVLSFTRLSAGVTWNVIPSDAFCEGTVRTLREDDRKKIKEAFRRIVSAHASQTDVPCVLDWTDGSPVVWNDENLCNAVRTVARECGLHPIDFTPELLSDDFGYLPESKEHAKGMYIKVGTGVGSPLHTSTFRVDTSVLEPTAAFIAGLLSARSEA